jgi:hypothetical protein
MEHYHAERGEGKLHDPYLTKKGYPEPAICPTCRAVYAKKRWSFTNDLPLKIDNMKEVNYHKCPACRKIEDGYAMGYVEIGGEFLKDHSDDLNNLIRAEENKAREKNPLERLISVSSKGGKIHVETTTDSLALRIGRRLESAYKGTGEAQYSEKFLRFVWNRD